jgi:hypothetical protein
VQLQLRVLLQESTCTRHTTHMHTQTGRAGQHEGRREGGRVAVASANPAPLRCGHDMLPSLSFPPHLIPACVLLLLCVGRASDMVWAGGEEPRAARTHAQPQHSRGVQHTLYLNNNTLTSSSGMSTTTAPPASSSSPPHYPATIDRCATGAASATDVQLVRAHQHA